MLLRDSYAEINLGAIAHNIKLAQQLGNGEKIMAVVKANAYGHGLLEVLDTMIACGIDLFGVATLSEAIAIKQKYPQVDVMILGHTPDKYLNVVNERGIIQTIFSLKQAKVLNAFAVPTRVHIKIDSGFHRLGFAPKREAIGDIKAIEALPNVEVEGIFSHLALGERADDVAQYELFTKFLSELKAAGLTFKYRHICDSISYTRYPEYRMNMVRLGAWLFGMKSYDQSELDLIEALSLKSRISHISEVKAGEGVGYDYLFRAECDMRVATIPIGYADGYPRNMSNGGYVIIDGKPAAVTGVINMDQMMVSLLDHPNTKVGDPVTLYGAADGLPIGKIAEIAKTNKNEIMCRLTPRVARIYR
ncbi:MAG: alanine racemase [Clostridiales bacterium]|nr:MAG: alanine racemase [Clostridiales bacterium]